MEKEVKRLEAECRRYVARCKEYEAMIDLNRDTIKKYGEIFMLQEAEISALKSRIAELEGGANE